MKICFFIQWLKTGGAERNVSILANSFVKIGHLVDIVLLGNVIEFAIDDRVKVHYISDFSGHENTMIKLCKMSNRRKCFTEYCDNNKPDVIICLLNSVLIYIPKKISIPIISSERSNPFKEINWIKRMASFYLYRRCDGLVFQTNAIMKQFPLFLQKKGIVIYNPIFLSAKIEPISYKNRNNNIVAVGRLHYSKGYFDLIDAFENVFKNHNDCVLDIYGDGELKDKLTQYINKKKLSDKVILKGNYPNVFELIKESRCYVLTSYYEGMPNSLLESMCYGIPSISFDCNFGPSEMIINNQNGILIKNRNLGDLSKAITDFIENEELSNYCSANATKLFYLHSIDIISIKYLDFINKIINKRRKKE